MMLLKALYVKLTLWINVIIVKWNDTIVHLVVKQTWFLPIILRYLQKLIGRLYSVEWNGICKLWNSVQFVNKPFDVGPQNIFISQSSVNKRFPQ